MTHNNVELKHVDYQIVIAYLYQIGLLFFITCLIEHKIEGLIRASQSSQ